MQEGRKSAGSPGWVQLGRTSRVLVQNLGEGEEDYDHGGSATGGTGEKGWLEWTQVQKESRRRFQVQ